MNKNDIKNDFYKIGDKLVITKEKVLKNGILKDIATIKGKKQYFVEYTESNNQKNYRWCTGDEITKVFNNEIEDITDDIIHANIKGNEDIGKIGSDLMKVFGDSKKRLLEIDREFVTFLFNTGVHINHLKMRIEELEKNLKQSDEYKNKIYKELNQEKNFNEYLFNALKRRVIESEK